MTTHHTQTTEPSQSPDASSAQSLRASVIIPVKGAEYLPPCLDSLEQQDYDGAFDVIVIDGWHDDAVAAVANRYPRVKLIRSHDNLLQCIGRNIGSEQTSADYVIFLDADCVADPTFVSAAVRALDAGAKMVGGPVLDARPWNPFAVADNYSQFADFPPTRPSGQAEYFPGCNMAMSRDDFLAIGGFPDTKMPAGEDTLLCFAMADRYPNQPDAIRFDAAMRIRHIGRTTLSGFLKHQAFFGYCRGSVGLKMTHKHRKLGRYRLVAIPLVAKRLKYMLGQTLRLHKRALPKLLLLSPLVLLGMFWWASGFRRACREPIQPYSQLYDVAK